MMDHLLDINLNLSNCKFVRFPPPNGKIIMPCQGLPSKPPRRRLMPRLFRRLDRRGVAATEFALVSIPFFLVIIGCMEVGWQLATGAALDHAALRASRYGMTGADSPPSWQTTGQENVPTCRSENIPWVISRSTNGMLKTSRLTVTTTNWSNVSTVTGGSTTGAGIGGRITSYALAYDQPFITGIVGRTLFGGNAFRHQAFLLVKNEPFENATC